mmetsp:Transcript_2984/g.8046  ORF Transcript_2984/g.8046 Transcript_2984/m.8046 type:complete len:196 (-) Transcript_2984:38-625(-)
MAARTLRLLFVALAALGASSSEACEDDTCSEPGTPMPGSAMLQAVTRKMEATKTAKEPDAHSLIDQDAEAKDFDELTRQSRICDPSCKTGCRYRDCCYPKMQELLCERVKGTWYGGKAGCETCRGGCLSQGYCQFQWQAKMDETAFKERCLKFHKEWCPGISCEECKGGCINRGRCVAGGSTGFRWCKLLRGQLC